MIGPLFCGAAAMVAVHFLLLHTYWEYSEGVYALTARELLHGGDLYGQIVGAQPPGVFLVGAALLAIHSGVEWLRLGVGCLQLAGGLIAARIVYRLTKSRLAAWLTPAAFVLTPWAVHEHGALTPELVSLPVMMGAALLSADRERSVWGGFLCGVLVLIKLPLAIPAAALVLVAADRRRAAVAATLTVAAGLGATWALVGNAFWKDVLVAQMHSGSRSLDALAGFWAQAAWNLIGLLFCAGVALRCADRRSDRRLLTIVSVLVAANLVSYLSDFKQGTSLNITVPVEASLVPLALAGTVFAIRGARTVRAARRSEMAPFPPWPAASPWLSLGCVAALCFTLIQSMSLITAPQHPVPFLRAFSAPAWGAGMTAPQFEQAVAAARACPLGEPFGGPPLVAMAAGRSLPANQPDQFLTANSPTLARVKAEISAVRDVCAQPAPPAATASADTGTRSAP